MKDALITFLAIISILSICFNIILLSVAKDQAQVIEGYQKER